MIFSVDKEFDGVFGGIRKCTKIIRMFDFSALSQVHQQR